MKNERDLFKQAYLNLRTADSIPFPDAVFDEYVRLRDSEGYKLVPAKCTNDMVYAAKEVDGRLSAFKYGDVWDAMIGAVE